MANEEDGQDRSEEATPERREEFRERGDVPVSREIASVAALLAGLVYLSSDLHRLLYALTDYLLSSFSRLNVKIDTIDTLFSLSMHIWFQFLLFVAPICCVCAAASIFSTLAQTRLNFSWKKIYPSFNRLNPVEGLGRLLKLSTIVELAKGIFKITIIFVASYLILYSEWSFAARLMFTGIFDSWKYWATITNQLTWTVVALTIFVAAGDLFFNYLSTEKRLKMTKQEIKEEYKKRELDPHIKSRLRRMQRDMSMAKAIRATRNATVLVTNPTHFAVAIKYASGERAPKIVAKGADHLALKLREVAKESGVPIVENPPLARALFKSLEPGQDIPESLWVAVSEVIRYVIKLKGWQFLKRSEA